MLSAVENESAGELLSSISPEVLCCFDHFTFSAGDFVEIQGSASSGKTRLLYFFAAHCLLFSSTKAVIILDCDNQWISLHFLQTLRSLIDTHPSRFPIPPHISTRDFAAAYLHRVHVFRTPSLLSLSCTLLSLSGYHNRHMPNQEISMIAIDCISAFHWQLRMQAQTLPKAPSELHPVMLALERIRLQYNPLILITNWGLFPASPENSHQHDVSQASCSATIPLFLQHLRPPFPPFPPLGSSDRRSRSLTHHITLHSFHRQNQPSEATQTRSDDLNESSRQVYISVREASNPSVVRAIQHPLWSDDKLTAMIQ